MQAELTKAITDAMSAHQAMSMQALGSDSVQARVLSVLLGPGQLRQALRTPKAPPMHA